MTRAEEIIAQLDPIARAIREAVCAWKGGGKAVDQLHRIDEVVTAVRESLVAPVAALAADAERYNRINTPELHDFVEAVHNEALHQRERWGAESDGGKSDADWFWLIGYLAGKALHNPPREDMTAVETRLHRIITVAAAAANWHAATLGAYAAMRPGIDPEADRAA